MKQIDRLRNMNAEETRITKELDDILNYPCSVCAFKGIGKDCWAYSSKEICPSYKDWLESEVEE